MEPGFWQARWETKQIGFHEGKPNAYLVKHLDRLGLAPGARIFLPLCGKTRDIAYLLGQGFAVAGAELSRIAVEELFAELEVVPEITAAGDLLRFSAPGLDIFQGDIFALTAETLGPVDAVYDRAALIALPPDMRPRYAAHVTAITGAVPQLVVTIVYDQSLVGGPPFSVPSVEVHALHDAGYRVTHLDAVTRPDALKGQWEATEEVHLLERR
ncbi:thiopurine S-methyltransferase [Xanthobacter aminoxidans]|uniref:thiopurine S-methyltransferase n=1 Tax=Xanthobacter aminoxidans TaxID=186280 RepID=UPI00372713D9